ncbi:DNA repair protein RAD51-like protein 3 [Hibiscus syriacus]|uniref:DNA repair protein RAD51 homolog 3 n=1 Tax=Hibiscus syriacus TaxID=106335 RepID=A0A6A2YAG0_HIBSY|nr:DNA repair protein RAD51 homolog 3 isoform X1 [Hibiscus syriacus]KAE8679505.1 DNA repair protein RAD51-like protein 3 [Hibiscus syriacus]
MEVLRLPISASQRGKLISAGYTSLSSISSISSSDLARDLKVSETEAMEILKVASQSRGAETSNASSSVVEGAQSAWDMLHDEESLVHITTSSADLDNILGGGIHCKEVTEIGGVPGIGKTQLGIQIAVNVQIPHDFGGLGGKAIYIDTEGSFMVERAFQIAEACVEDMSEYNRFLRKDFQECKNKLQPKDILENIFYFRICSYTEQIALINYLDKFIYEHKDVKVVVVDSVTFHFRQDFDDMALRTRVLSGLALKLMNLAKKFSLAVVLLNQVTTKHTEGSFQLALALGDSWSHSCTNRIVLYWNGNERFAYIDKSPSLRSASAAYSVTGRGIRNSSSSCKRIKMM